MRQFNKQTLFREKVEKEKKILKLAFRALDYCMLAPAIIF